MKMSDCGKSGGFQPRRDRFGDGRSRAGRESRLDLDHLLIDFARQLSIGLRRQKRSGAERNECQRDEAKELEHLTILACAMGMRFGHAVAAARNSVSFFERL